MLRSACSRPYVLKAFNTTFALELAIAAASSKGAAASANAITPNNTVHIGNTEIPSRTLRVELLEAENKYIKPLINFSGSCRDKLEPTGKIREYLKKGQYIKLLIKLSVDSHLDYHYISDFFSNGSLTNAEYSVFVNKLLSEEVLDAKLSNVIPDTPHTELIYRLFEIYCKHVLVQECVTPLQLHDLNLFVKTFVSEGQLGKAQRVLDYILDRMPLDVLLERGEVDVLVQILRLRCGALSRYWKIQPASQTSSAARKLGDGTSRCQLTSTYKCIDDKLVLHVMNTILTGKSWKYRRSAQLDAAIVYSLGYAGQIDLIEEYIKHRWTPGGEPASVCSPTSDLLVAIVTSYCKKQGDMEQALQVLDQFLKLYPSVELDVIFWRRLLQLSVAVWDRKKDSKASLAHGCWVIMKQWHAQRQLKIPFDYGILQGLYLLFVRTRNRSGAMEVLTQCFPSTFIKPELAIRGSEMALLRKYQKLVLKLTAARGNYHKGLQLCKDWSVNSANRLEMQNYFLKRREIYDRKRRLQKDKKATLQQKYDDMEEEDMLLGRLW